MCSFSSKISPYLFTTLWTSIIYLLKYSIPCEVLFIYFYSSSATSPWLIPYWKPYRLNAVRRYSWFIYPIVPWCMVELVNSGFRNFSLGRCSFKAWLGVTLSLFDFQIVKLPAKISVGTPALFTWSAGVANLINWSKQELFELAVYIIRGTSEILFAEGWRIGCHFWILNTRTFVVYSIWILSTKNEGGKKIQLRLGDFYFR